MPHYPEDEHADDPLRPHRHDPNPEPPSADPAFTLSWPGGSARISPNDLRRLPPLTLPNCYIVSTGHGTSGPFAFTGVPLLQLIDHLVGPDIAWQQVAIISGDGFGTRLTRQELTALPAHRPALLAYALDHQPLTRAEGLVRLIEPNESNDALRQVKWIATVKVEC
jgi:DMSO/TMAO reductase YedYZ molybdopterin-dependent catalytic subunit